MVLKYVLQLSLIWLNLIFIPIVILLVEILSNSSLNNWTPWDWFYWFTFLLSVIDNFLEPLLLEFDTYDQIVSLVTLITYQNLIKLFCFALKTLHFLTVTISLLFTQVFCTKCLLGKNFGSLSSYGKYILMAVTFLV